MSTPLLQLENVSIEFKQEGTILKVVENISFEISQGKIAGLVGESGSGKSVIALSILQLLSKQATAHGKIIFTPDNNHSIDLNQLSHKEMNQFRGKKIGVIFQEPMTSLNPLLTCGEQVIEVLIHQLQMSRSAAKKRTIELFAQVELPDPASMIHRYPHQISGGQKQRVMIAMAISCNPSLLIADEPTTALDVCVQKTLLTLLKNIQQKNKMAILLISHDLGLMEEVADEMVVIYKGAIVEKGNAKKILQQPAHAYTKALLLCKPHAGSKGKKLTVLSDLLESTQPIIKENLPFHSKNNPLNDEAPLLSVQSLKVYFPAATNFWGAPTKFYQAVDDVSFDVFANETIGIVGESGCGKTTLGRTILQLTKATEGKIILNGTDLCATNKKNISKQLQMVFQDPYGSLNPALTIGDAITEPMKVHQLFGNKKERKEKAIHLLEQVNLKSDFFNRYPHQFSGGQRQRICIARALALEPSFLIFDESVSALDLSVQAQVLNLINDLKASYQFTSLFISHDLSVVHYISDRILVMRQGKIIEQGQADEVFYAPKNEYTRQLIEAIPGKNK